MSGKMKVLLTTEGTYPFHQGGVSTWCDLLVKKLPTVDYTIYSVMMNPFVTQKFKLPKRTNLFRVPLWGTEEPSEHLPIPFSKIYQAKLHTNDEVIEHRFLPIFRDLIDEILSIDSHPDRLGQILVALYDFFQEFEYKVTFKSEVTWNAFKAIVLDKTSDPKNRLSPPDVFGMIQSLGWVYRFLNIINTPIPEADVSHASAAAFCGIPCVIAKLKYKTPFLLTEHGVYLREQYLSLTKSGYSSYLNTFLIRLVQSVTTLNYTFADQVSPVCLYNTRWEKRFGVKPKKIQVIYNGVDHRIFMEAPKRVNQPLTIALIARIDPIKDILTFIRAANLVRNRFPDVTFVVHGDATVPDYLKECLELTAELGMQDALKFAGHTTNMVAAYQNADIVVLTSISEAFPYSVVEAMMSGRPVVATDVGGVGEALADTGILAKPRNPDSIAEGIAYLVQNPELRETMGAEARERALSLFTIDRVMELHLKSYIRLATRAIERTASMQESNRQTNIQLLFQKGYVLYTNGFYKEAIEIYREALRLQPRSRFTPLLINEIANCFNCLGEFERSAFELTKLESYEIVTQQERPA